MSVLKYAAPLHYFPLISLQKQVQHCKAHAGNAAAAHRKQHAPFSKADRRAYPCDSHEHTDQQCSHGAAKTGRRHGRSQENPKPRRNFLFLLNLFQQKQKKQKQGRYDDTAKSSLPLAASGNHKVFHSVKGGISKQHQKLRKNQKYRDTLTSFGKKLFSNQIKDSIGHGNQSHGNRHMSPR